MTEERIHSGATKQFVPQAEDLEKINQLTCREFMAEELYTFRMALCDNDIDRDYERFSDEALEALAPMFVGMTGLCDHETRAENQQARIYETRVVSDPARQTRDGRPYRYLEAKAYMVRTQGNQDTILEIEGGIRREVSVSCRVKQKRCSICGSLGGCGHRPGQEYDGALCWRELEEPEDAYEWSFVAVPAQPAAGVLKSWKEQVVLEKSEYERLCQRIQTLEEDSREVRCGLMRQLGELAGESGAAKKALEAAGRMSLRELRCWKQLLEERGGIAKAAAPQSQFGAAGGEVSGGREDGFLI